MLTIAPSTASSSDASTGILIIAIVICVICWITLAAILSDIAKEKGYSKRSYFWLTLVFGLPAYLVVIALPDITARQQRDAEEKILKQTQKIVENLDELIDFLYLKEALNSPSSSKIFAKAQYNLEILRNELKDGDITEEEYVANRSKLFKEIRQLHNGE